MSLNGFERETAVTRGDGYDPMSEWSWWPWVLVAVAGSVAGLVLAAVFAVVVM